MTPSERAKRLALRRKALGISVHELATEMELTTAAVYTSETRIRKLQAPLDNYEAALNRLQARWGLEPLLELPQRVVLPEDIRDEVIRLWRMRMKPKEIAEGLGIGHIQVRKILENVTR